MRGSRSGRSGWRLKVEQFQRIDVREMYRQGRVKKGFNVGVTVGERERVVLEVTWTPCRFGGERPWWWCPSCGYRVAILYVYGSRIACRGCLRLTYASTCEDAVSRAERRQRKILRGLGGEGDIGEEFPEKPPRMRWSTYERLVDAFDEAEAVRDSNFMQKVVALNRRGRR